MGAIEGVSEIEIAGNGYINVRLDRGYYGDFKGSERRDSRTQKRGEK